MRQGVKEGPLLCREAAIIFQTCYQNTKVDVVLNSTTPLSDDVIHLLCVAHRGAALV